MYWRKIAAAAAAAFRRDRSLPVSWKQRFPDARSEVRLSFFDIVRILWALHVIYHGRFLKMRKQSFLRLSSFARYKELLFTMSELWRWISFTNLSWPRLLKIHTENIFNCSNLKIWDWTKFFFCFNRCECLWVLSVSGRCKFFAYRSALSSSVIIKSSCDIEFSFLDRMVEFRRCTKIFNYAHEWHQNKILEILEHSVSRCMRWYWNINLWLKIFLYYFHFWAHLASTVGSALACFSGIRSTQLCDCSVVTEPVRGMNNPLQQVDITIDPREWMVSWLLFFFECSTSSRTYTWNTRCPEYSKYFTIFDTRRSHLPPWLVAYPSYYCFLLRVPSPASVQFWCVLFEILEVRAQESSLFFFSIEDYSITEVLRFDVLSLYVCLNFVENGPMLWLQGISST